jgi:predicted AlkP superfamily pyrophosphatase or phosphodiesterase
MARVVLVLLDGLRNDIAAEHMGYLEHLVEMLRVTRYTVTGELPSLSRPMYETIHTGVPAYVHGVTANAVARRSTMPNIFSEVHAAGKVTAAAAFCWFAELYNRAPYDRVHDREVDDERLPIRHGRFYSEEGPYPDSEVFMAGAMLLMRYMPDYLLMHPMMLDWVGEQHGGRSAQYRQHASVQDQYLASFIPLAHEAGCTVLVTGDHGMDDEAGVHHGGKVRTHRMVPLYIVPPDGKGRGDTEETISQLQIAPTILALLEVAIPHTMRMPPAPA